MGGPKTFDLVVVGAGVFGYKLAIDYLAEVL